MIYPEIFEGFVMAFFTSREVGLEVEGLTGKRIYYPVQKHTDTVITLNAGEDKPATGDAVITRRRDIMLGIKAADCVPILLYDKINEAIGVVHAGWRGTAAGLLIKTIGRMAEVYGTEPEDLLLAMGPAIRWCCYDVDKDVRDAVSKATGKGDYSKKSKDGKYCLDLQSANKVQALSAGLRDRNISITEQCTFCYPKMFHSYRYALKQWGPTSAEAKMRQGGYIGMP